MSVSLSKPIGGAINITYGPFNGYVYFFHTDGTYSRFNRLTCELEYYAPLEKWIGWPAHWPYPHTATSWDNEYVYFLRGPECFGYNMLTDRVEGPIAQVSDNFSGWPDHWLDRVDAALYWGYHPGQKRRKAYFFRDNDYLRYDVGEDRVDEGYPGEIGRGWNGWPSHWTQVWAGVDWGNGKVYFFTDTEYLRYDKFFDRVDDGYPQPVGAFVEEHQAKLLEESGHLFLEEQVPAGPRPAFVAAVRALAQQLDLRPNWLMASMWTESGFNPRAGGSGPYVGLHQMSLPLIYSHWGRLALPPRFPDVFQGQPFDQLTPEAKATLASEFANLGFDQIHVIGAWLKGSLGAFRKKCRSFDQLRLVGFGGVGFAEVDRTLLAPVVARGNPRYDLNQDRQIDVAEFREAVFDLIHSRFAKNPAVDSALRHSLG